MRALLRWVAGLVALVVLIVVGPTVWVKVRAYGHLYSERGVPQAPVALVLGAGVRPGGQPTPFLAARLDLAVRLYAQGRVRAILVSGDNRTHRYDEPTAMRDYLVAHGVPDDKVVRDFGGRDTYDSCVRAAEVFGVDRVIVVSQAYHVPRAVAVCRSVGLDADGVGDTTMQRRYPDTYDAGRAREWPANIKAAVDVLFRRDPAVGGPPDDALDTALSD